MYLINYYKHLSLHNIIMNKILMVIGGSGFIGSHFIDYMISKDFKIINVDKISYASNLDYCKSSSKMTFCKIDITSYRAINELIYKIKPHIIINFAAESHVDRSIDDPNIFIKSNINGTANILISILKNRNVILKNNKHFKYIHISTDEVYGDFKKGLASEDSKYKPNSPYAASKASSDLICRSFYKTYGIPIIICNSSNNYGQRQFLEKFIPRSICMMKMGMPVEIYGDGKQTRQWIHVSDNVNALSKIIKYGKIGETYNIGGKNIIQNINVIKKIEEIMTKKFSINNIKINFVKDRPGHDTRYAISSKKLISHTNWKPTISFENGLFQTISYCLNIKINKKFTNILKRRGSF